MSEFVSQILSHMDALSKQERAELAYAFVHSLEPEEEDGVEKAWDAELSWRIAEIRSGKITGKPAAELFAELNGRKP